MDILEPIKEVMSRLGFTIIPSSIKGLSGVDHEFALVAESEGGGIVVFDVLDDSKPDDVSILTLYTKAYDVGALGCVAITDGEIGKGARRLADLFKMKVVDWNVPTAGEEIERYIEESISSHLR